jgi:hypothetical protein
MDKYNQPKHDFIISDVSKDKEFQSAANEEQQMYHEKIKELENMVCELINMLELTISKSNCRIKLRSQDYGDIHLKSTSYIHKGRL